MSSLVRISEAASLALHTLAILARERRRFTNQELAGALHGSEHHLAKVMQRLTRVGMVDSTRGPRGGFQLARAPEEITLLEIYEAVEGPVAGHECLLGETVCSGSECMLGELVRHVHDEVRFYLADTTLAKMAHGFRILPPQPGR